MHPGLEDRYRRFAVAACIVCVLACGPTRPGITPPGEPDPRRERSPISVDFGRVPVGDRVIVPVHIDRLAPSDRRLAFDHSVFVGANSTATPAVIDLVFQPPALAAFAATATLAVENGTQLLLLSGKGVERELCAECDALATPVCDADFTTLLTAKTGTCASDRCTYTRAAYPCGRDDACCRDECPPVLELAGVSAESVPGATVPLRLKVSTCDGFAFAGATIGATIEGEGTVTPAFGRTDHNGVLEAQGVLRQRRGIDVFKFELLGWFEPLEVEARITAR